MSALMSGAPSQGYEVMAAEVNIPCHPLFSGRIDCILSRMSDGEKIIVDFKSCGKWTFDHVKKGEVSQTYKDQLNMYMYLLGIHKAYLLFVCKDNSDFYEYEVEYDEERAKEVEADIKDFYDNYVYKGVMPPKCDGGMWGCDVCENGFDTMNAQEEIKTHLLKGGKYLDLYE